MTSTDFFNYPLWPFFDRYIIVPQASSPSLIQLLFIPFSGLVGVFVGAYLISLREASKEKKRLGHIKAMFEAVMKEEILPALTTMTKSFKSRGIALRNPREGQNDYVMIDDLNTNYFEIFEKTDLYKIYIDNDSKGDISQRMTRYRKLVAAMDALRDRKSLDREFLQTLISNMHERAERMDAHKSAFFGYLDEMECIEDPTEAEKTVMQNLRVYALNDNSDPFICNGAFLKPAAEEIRKYLATNPIGVFARFARKALFELRHAAGYAEAFKTIREDCAIKYDRMGRFMDGARQIISSQLSIDNPPEESNSDDAIKQNQKTSVPPDPGG